MSGDDSARKAQILLVDDHAMVVEGLRRVLDDQPDMCVCGTADSVDRAFMALQSTPADLVLLDLSLRGASGLDLLGRMREAGMTTPVLILSMHDETVHAERALKAGARGYIMKEEAPDELVGAIHRVLHGDVRLSAAVTNRLLRRMVGAEGTVSVSPLDALSDRELEVFRLTGSGCGPTEIAQRLGLSVKTVETHREHLKRKLNLRTTAELAKLAVEHYATSR